MPNNKAPLMAVFVGAGARGRYAYAPYALAHSGEMRFVTVAELPKDYIIDRFCRENAAVYFVINLI